mgnify:CR=1 FL=1
MSDNWIDESDICFVTGKIMSTDDRARFTWEFDAWVSEEGQKIVEEDARGENPSFDNELIFREWYAEDAAAAGRDEDYMDADANNEEFRQWHK